MKKILGRILALLITSSMLLAGAACKKEQQPTATGVDAIGGDATASPSSVTGETEPPYYSAKEIEIFSAEKDGDWITPEVIPMGDRIGLLLSVERYVYSDDPNRSGLSRKSVLYTYDMDGNQLSEADLSAFSGEYSSVGSFQSDGEGNIWAILRTTDEDYYETYESTIERITLDPSGKEVKSRFDLGTGMTPMSDSVIDDQGRIYILEGIVSMSIRIINADGTPLCTIPVDSPQGWFKKIGKNVYFKTYQSTQIGSDWIDKEVYFPIDPDTQSLGEAVDPVRLMSSIEGGCEIRSQDVFLLDPESEQMARYQAWETTYDPAKYQINSWLPISAEKVVGIAKYNDMYRMSQKTTDTYFLIILTREANNPDLNKKVLVLGMTRAYSPEIKSAVFRFNRKSEEYRIEIRDYSSGVVFDGIDPRDWYEHEKSSAAELLRADILLGEGPDILVLQEDAYLAPEILERQGYLVDLYALAEGDPSFRKEDYRTNILSLFERDEKLFRFPLTFGLSGLVGPTRLLGDRSGWTIEECTGILSSLPDGAVAFPNLERKDLLAGCLQASLYSFVDYKEKTVDFDSDEFRAILAFADRFGSDEVIWEDGTEDDIMYEPEGLINWSELLRQGNLAIQPAGVGNAFSISNEESIHMFNEPVTFVGYPSADRSGMKVHAGTSIAICESCPDTAAAWEFVRICIGEEFQSEFYPYSEEPIHLGVSQARIEQAISAPLGAMESMYTMDVLTQQDADYYIRLVESASVLAGQDQPIIDIVQEEAAAYFAGVKTAEEVSRIVQDRVTTFVNERG